MPSEKDMSSVEGENVAAKAMMALTNAGRAVSGTGGRRGRQAGVAVICMEVAVAVRGVCLVLAILPGED